VCRIRAVTVRDAFESLLVSVECPRCGYALDVQLIDLRLEARIFCPNCKIEIQLMDESASVHGAGEDIEAAMSRLKGIFS
jgi:rubredoxin